MNKITLALAISMLLAGCGEAAQNPSPAAPAATPAPAAPSAAAADQPAHPPPPQSANQMLAQKMDSVLAGDWRSATNKARDQYRHPAQTLEFFGLTPAMNVVEVTPGGGWYSEVLAPLLKGTGTYTAAIAQPKKAESEDAQDKTGLHAKFAGDAADFGDAKIVEFDPRAPNFGAQGSADMVVTFRNVHNWVMAKNAPLMFKGFYDVLKPGGVLGVTDHRASPGADLDKIIRTGYLPEDFVIKLATDAGFQLQGKSEINANPKDDRDHEKGVWTLPPTLELGDKDREKYVAIGESDRMTLKFVKPVTDKIFKASAEDQAPQKAEPR